MFDSPDTLRNYALTVASQLREKDLIKQSEILEHRANLTCTTGWEWLGELGKGVEIVINLGPLASDIEEKLNNILQATKSTEPYN